MSRILLVVVDITNGAPPPERFSLTRFYMVFDLGVAALILLQIDELGRVPRRPKGVVGIGGRWRPLNIVRRAFRLSWELLGGLGLIWFATLTGIGWRGNLRAYPDFALAAVAASALGLAIAMLCSVRLLGAALARGEVSRSGSGRQSPPLPGPAA